MKHIYRVYSILNEIHPLIHNKTKEGFNNTKHVKDNDSNVLKIKPKKGLTRRETKFNLKESVFYSGAFFTDSQHQEKTSLKNINIYEKQEKTIDIILAKSNYFGGKNKYQYIRNPDHLHVILGFYPRNIRDVYSLLSCARRNGRSGTSQIICPKSEYFNSMTSNESSISLHENDNYLIDCVQRGHDEIIQDISNQGHSWIFDENIINESFIKKLTPGFFGQIRSYTINVSRSTAIEYEFPFGFNIEDYFNIQKQRIYSVINCPNCLFTWRLVSQYYREMVLEGWSLFITNEIDSKVSELIQTQPKDSQITETELYIEANRILSEDSEFRKIKSHFYYTMNQFLPMPNYVSYRTEIRNKDVKKDPILDFIESFLFTTSKTNDFLKIFLNRNKFYKLFHGISKRFTIKIGFYPFSIPIEDVETLKNMEIGLKYKPDMHIHDPELHYGKLSITKNLDPIFSQIYDVLQLHITKYIPINIYLKRTITGTEFGFCFQPFVNANQRQFLDLSDIDPSFIASINVKSDKPLLIGVLLFIHSIISSCFSSLFQLMMVMFHLNFSDILSSLLDETIDNTKDELLEKTVYAICTFFILRIKNLLGKNYQNSPIQAILKNFVANDDESFKPRLKGKLSIVNLIIKIAISFVMYIGSVFTILGSQNSIRFYETQKFEENEKLIEELLNISENATKAMIKVGFDENDQLKDEHALDFAKEKTSEIASRYENIKISEYEKELRYYQNKGKDPKQLLFNLIQ